MIEEKDNPFQPAAVQLVANKIFNEYVLVIKDMPAEPESFVEQWIVENIIDASQQMEDKIWRCFLLKLSEYRKKK